MKVGSLVECVSNHLVRPWSGTLPEIGKVYTVRDVTTFFGHGYIRVEEIIQPSDKRGEWWMDAEWFREIQPPMDLSFIEEIQFEETKILST